MKRELYSVTVEKTTLNVTQNKVDAVRKNSITKSACRVYDNGYLGISGCFGKPTEENWKAAEKNLELHIPYEYEPESGKVRVEDRREQLLSEKEFLEKSEALLEKLSEQNPNFIFSNKLISIDLDIVLENDQGLRYEAKDHSYIVSLVFKRRNSNAVFDGGIGYQRRTFDEEAFLRDAHRYLEANQNEVALPKEKKLPVVMSFENLYGSLIEGLSAEALGKGTSIFADKVGKKVFSDRFTLSVDRSKENILAPFFDVEGSTLEGDRIALIENGVIQRGCCDKKNAAEFGVENTACGEGGYDDVPSLGCPGLWTTPSDKTLQEILGNEKAILIDTMAGGDCTAEGNFASPVQSAYLWENGKMVGRLPEFGLSGSIYEMFGEDYLGVTADKPFFEDSHMLVVKMNLG